MIIWFFSKLNTRKFCNEPNLKTYPYVTDAAIVTFPRIDKYHKFETFTYLSTWKGITGYSSLE